MRNSLKPYDWSNETNIETRRSPLPAEQGRPFDWEKFEDRVIVRALVGVSEMTEPPDRGDPGQAEVFYPSFANLALEPQVQAVEEANFRMVEEDAQTTSIEDNNRARLAAATAEMRWQTRERRKNQLAGLFAAAVFSYLTYRWGYEIYENDQEMMQNVRETIRFKLGSE